jgi:alpha-ketoglutarate-dependent taurine dioxygenase
MRRELEPLIGFFVNTMVVRADLRGRPAFHDVVSRVRQDTIDGYTHQQVPFDAIVEALRPRRELTRDPFFDIMFTFQNVPSGTGLDLPEVELTPLPFDEWVAKRDLTMRLELQDDGYHGVVEYDTELFQQAHIEQLAQAYVDLLRELVGSPRTQIDHAAAFERIGRLTIVHDSDAGQGNRSRRTFESALRTAPAKVRVGDSTVTEYLPEHPGSLPAVVRARHAGLDLAAWAADHKSQLDELIGRHGGVLLRGFAVRTPADFRRFAQTQIAQLLNYDERSTPRSSGGEENVFTSTEYPSDQAIELHNEMSYAHSWPMRIAFYSHRTAPTGGATTISDSRRIHDLMPAPIREAIQAKGVAYVRNFGAGIDLTWQEAFQTSDAAAVEQYCSRAGISYEWLADGRLRTTQVRPGILRHPVTGEQVWFNSAHMFHPAGLAPAVQRSLNDLFDEHSLPRNALFGDGTPIPAQTIETIRAVCREATVRFAWQDGDVMLLDNMLASHGRDPYEGPRQVLVAFGDPADLSTGQEQA